MSCDPDNPDNVEALFPDQPPEIRFSQVSSICAMGHRPLALTGMFVQLLRQHFADPAHLDEIKLRTKFAAAGGWLPTPNTGLQIEHVLRWTPDLTEKRPGILVQRNDWHWDRRTIGDQAGDDYVSGHESYLGYWHGSHTFFAIADKGAEAELLGYEVARTLLHYSPEITNNAMLHNFMPESVGKPAVVEESSKNYVVPVTFKYVAEEYWDLIPHVPRLKRIVFKPRDFLD